MDNQPNIILINTHAKGIGSADNWCCPFDEIILDTLFQRTVKTRMKCFCYIPCPLQKIGYVFRVFST